jgi:signal transduction histidine kinase
VLASARVRFDRHLLEQAILNLLDNAAKYSFSDTVIGIYGGLTGPDRFHISIVNKGFRLSASDAAKAVKRGWRSEDARHSTGEGSGIGLWIVDNIMKAHGGELVVVPSDLDGYTEVKLIFPMEK